MKESDIRPNAIFGEYLRLAKLDIETYFSDVKKSHINCPACDYFGEHSFNKNGFDYCVCKNCKTLYVNPRPESDAFSNYYTNSLSSKFWATTFYKETAEIRRDKIWKPKAQLLSKVLSNLNAEKYQIVEIGGGYGIFAEEIQEFSSIKRP